MRILAVVELPAEGSPRLISDSPGLPVVEAYQTAYIASKAVEEDWRYLQHLLQQVGNPGLEIPMAEVAK